MSLKILSRKSNQALELGKYAISFIKTNQKIDDKVYERVKMFNTDAVVCGISALALRTNAPTLLRKEALSEYETNGKFKSKVFGSDKWVQVEKAIVANNSAVREWDSNGTVFGFNKNLKEHQAGEFGHNDFYSIALAAAHTNSNLNGKDVLKGMLLSDEIRGRLAEVFSLKTYKIDHVVHGAIATAATYGAMIGATAEEIESAIGMIVAHYIPFRAIRAGKQLSDSKGSSAAISSEVAVMSMRRAMNGFIGPKDIFRNPEAIFRYFTKVKDDSPFDIALGFEGSDFSVMGMHFKLGLYEHQSAGAIQGVVKILQENPEIHKSGLDSISSIKVTAYEPCYGIIGDPAKRNPTTRQSADHSMVFILSRLLKKSFDKSKEIEVLSKDSNSFWNKLMLTPLDYSEEALNCKLTRKIMEKISFSHGGKAYDEKYPEGIPSQVDIKLSNGKEISSGFVMFPPGHAANTTHDLKGTLDYKCRLYLDFIQLPKTQTDEFLNRLNNIEKLSNKELENLYNIPLKYSNVSIDDKGFDRSGFKLH